MVCPACAGGLRNRSLTLQDSTGLFVFPSLAFASSRFSPESAAGERRHTLPPRVRGGLGWGVTSSILQGPGMVRAKNTHGYHTPYYQPLFLNLPRLAFSTSALVQ